ncbi:MAG: CHAT domain-containing protein [Acidobacteria bacterium]|nr:CHAT domain-containing protein [Acidobacteriota bacterium]
MANPIKPAASLAHSLRHQARQKSSFFLQFFAFFISTVTGVSGFVLNATALNLLIGGQQTENHALALDKSIERALAGGEIHSYELALVAGQFCQIVVDQRGIDVVVALFAPNGVKLVETDGTNGAFGPEQVVLVPENAGTYRLEVRSLEKNAPAGRYEVKLEALRLAIPQDQYRIRAQQAYLDARRLRNQEAADSQRAAIAKYKEALVAWQTLKDRRMETIALHDLGVLYGDLGDYQQALEAYFQARAGYQSLADWRGQAAVLNNIGWIFAALGEHQKAIDLYEEARQLKDAQGERRLDPRILSNIGSEYASLGKFQKALEIHLQVLALRRAGNDRLGLAITLNNIANCYEHLGEKQKALDYYSQSLTYMPEVGNAFYTAATLSNIGAIYADLGEHQKALDHFNQALQLRRTIGDRNGEAATLHQIARLERNRGNLLEARNHIEAALAAVESLRANVASQQLRVSFFASVRRYHEFYLSLLMELQRQHPADGFDALALAASEKSRARSLLELLKEARAEIKQGVDPGLLERERNLQQQISEKAQEQMTVLSGKHTAEQGAEADKEIALLTMEYEQVQAQIRHTSPRYAALTHPTTLSLNEIQTSVLDENTLLLEYVLGEEKSYLWAVTPTSLKSYELPKRAEIEAAARHVYESLTARNQIRPRETPEQRRRRIDQADADFPQAVAALSRLIMAPVASQLENKRLLIVADGVLQYIPFAVLPEIGDQPLIKNHEIINLPSASVLAVLRQETSGRKPAAKTLAVLADPVFQRDDPRLKQTATTRAGNSEFVRLRFSRAEAEQIATLAPPDQTLKALDFAANRDLATSAELADYRIVHFATHALINHQHPELSGIVLSQMDERGQPRNGFLRLHEIYNLRLSADLVVLSACETALGKEVPGEGMIGLTRGFMYAGAPRVAASLWQTDDRAAAELMKRFYQRMLGEKMAAASALRAAQVSLWQDKRWAMPYFWAAFTLQGEWK